MCSTDLYLCCIHTTLAGVLTALPFIYWQARGQGGYDSDFSDEENGEKSVQKTKR